MTSEFFSCKHIVPCFLNFNIQAKIAQTELNESIEESKQNN